ncbi:hypothetical protein H0S70_07240 [Chryseobacterium manosquense]|uniref:Uncharacterized protein n=1 Tax=Chryseobacterium manosquense TaxID=2754694 RepID=A0A7H1DT92_9FLAO|nr:hypothetical protein [Chryseobacterium manosquense]QNS40200.1 hypothetical protein H0S70_07240 [Chryseobacterium manosquense]
MKTYYSLLYYQSSFGDRINVGLLMFSSKGVICSVNNWRMKKVKQFQPTAFKLLNFGMKQLTYHWNNISIPTVKQISDLHRNSNNIFGIDKPRFIDIEFTQENFDQFYNKIFKQ